jgi:hypothetical protein
MEPSSTPHYSSTPAAPVETKVKASTLGAGAGAIVAEFINWVLDEHVITPGVTGDLPLPVSGLVLLACTSGLAFAAGFRARHTPRPDLGQS